MQTEEEIISLGLVMSVLLPRPRAPLTVRVKLKWDRELNLLLAESQFEACYRMPAAAFVQLEDLLAPTLHRSPHAWVQRGYISVDNALQLTLRYFAGGSMHDIRRVAGVSKASFYRILWLVVDAINAVSELRLVFPRSPTAREASAAAFKTLSAEGVFSGCVGCVDGWLCAIRAPRLAETGGVGPQRYYSGHYRCYGVNVQACCDYRCRFTFVNVAQPGSCNDSRAFQQSALHGEMSEMENGFYLIGDNAYECDTHMLTPFTRVETTDIHRDAYNFYLSQLRIRVEMSFGLLAGRWQIFARPLLVPLEKVASIVQTAARLHNFVQNQRYIGSIGYDIVEECTRQGLVRRRDHELISLLGYAPTTTTIETEANSFMRQSMVGKIKRKNLLRPN
ncbi:hypothetical protein PF010_g23077 [Phytophthora fragariae]|uniref:DDE Tnp4 domain-containing protein n=1 Tax=Phytophthora fragariae TaxID=53985 RepID=A0A6A3QK27_9STRA|nr:hypothetical protein PF009_g21189 [Phytophthora fragariae]KAE9078132.1 hypothetical protein PF007_g23984 [Phytophthora fragariae]KAE9078591.1 hypothetical protein PF010_g23077 [Phytophthora fragariae]KAE9099486.1 hypothetical protein PF006_g23126 [Phytophthora fragariae]KAE9189878.1 hypothetical protein PF002_g24929 [Phytophthora fragariae]